MIKLFIKVIKAMFHQDKDTLTFVFFNKDDMTSVVYTCTTTMSDAAAIAAMFDWVVAVVATPIA